MVDGNGVSKRPMFGARVLEDRSKVFDYNVWDNVEWDASQEEEARTRVEKQAEKKIPEEHKEKLKKETGDHWDKFYDSHQNRFFKDRHWLFTEFPELTGSTRKPETPVRVFPSYGRDQITPSLDTESSTSTKLPDTSVKCANASGHQLRRNYLEIGCGVGNTVFPILEYDINPNLFIYCCDFSKKAVDILKSHSKYDSKRCCAFMCDVTADKWEPPFTPSSIDITTLIFMLSAIHPNKMQHVVNQVYHFMRPGGLVFFRDYGRYDMAQLRFKEGQMMEDNFYVRKDGTFVYFFTQEEVRDMFCRAGFLEEQNLTDRRLQVNRFRQLKMYRVWVQAKYRKPLS